jgi:hypothetical protein
MSGYAQTFLTGVVMLGDIYYLPVYFQACKGASPIGAGVDQLSLSFVGVLSSVISGISVKKSGSYRPQLWLCWMFVLVGHGLFFTLNENSSLGHGIGYIAVDAIGIGALITTTYFPVLAPLPVTSNGLALALFMFLRNFAQVWGITIGGAILQNQLQTRLPQEFFEQIQLSSRDTLAYAAIPLIPALPEELKAQVQKAFADSLRVVWIALLGVAGAGMLSSLLMKPLKLHTQLDDDWTLEQNKEGAGLSQVESLERPGQ